MARHLRGQREKSRTGFSVLPLCPFFYCVASHVKGLRFLQFGVKQNPSSSYLGALGNLSGAGSPSLTSPATSSTWSAMPESGAAALLFPHNPPIAGFNSHAKLALVKNPACNNCLLSHKSLSLFSSPSKGRLDPEG